MSAVASLLRQPRLHGVPNLLLVLGHLLFAGIILHHPCLVEGILVALLKLLSANLLPLLLPQSGVLLLDLGQPPLFKGFVGGLEASLRVTVDLLRAGVGGEREGVEGVVDARGVEGRCGLGGGLRR